MAFNLSYKINPSAFYSNTIQRSVETWMRVADRPRRSPGTPLRSGAFAALGTPGVLRPAATVIPPFCGGPPGPPPSLPQRSHQCPGSLALRPDATMPDDRVLEHEHNDRADDRYDQAPQVEPGDADGAKRGEDEAAPTMPGTISRTAPSPCLLTVLLAMKPAIRPRTEQMLGPLVMADGVR